MRASNRPQRLRWKAGRLLRETQAKARWEKRRAEGRFDLGETAEGRLGEMVEM